VSEGESAKKKKPRGKVIKLSLELSAYLKSRMSRGEGYDAVIRRLLGLPTRKGEPQGLAEFYVVPNDGKPIIRLTLAEARGDAILQATKKKLKKAERVLTVREVP